MGNQQNIKLKKAPQLNQRVKDSLQAEAWNYGRPFYSSQFQVNVDPEDGVLENRVFYKDGSELKYKTIDKPFNSNIPQGKSNNPFMITEKAYEKQNKKMRSDHKKETGSTLGDRQTSGTGSRRVSFACRFAGMKGSMTDDNGEPSKLAMALKKWGFSSKGEASSFCSSNKES